jgi:predicted acylesterase/phospholipase RssA
MASTHAVPLAAPLSPGAPKRALVLPGGGLRLSYQAGILLALQEAGLAFQYIDGTSGGSLNMSMLLSGLEPAEICERWRSLNLRDTISFLPLKEYLKVENLEGLGDADGFRTKVLPHFGIDFGRIRAVDSIAAGYNVLDYGNKAVKAIPHRDIDEDMVIAGMSLPGVFPPVRKDGGIYLDTGFVQDANLLETVKNGAEDIWVLWGLGNTGVYRGGPLHLYVQMLEMSADTALNHQLEAIRELNGRIERGESPYGQTRPIRVHVIKPEYPLPLDPDLYLGKIDHATLIDMGYADGKRYLQTCATAPAEIPPNPSRMQDPAPGIRLRFDFTGELAGPDSAARQPARLELCLHINDLERFIAAPEPAARLTGHLNCPAFGACVPVYGGQYTLVHLPDRTRRLDYRMNFDSGGRQYTLAAEQTLHDNPGLDLWQDLSTLTVSLFEGKPDGSAPHGAATFRLAVPGIREWMNSVQATETQSPADGLKTVGRFAEFFLGELCAVYGWFGR